MFVERERSVLSGWFMLVVLVLGLVAAGVGLWSTGQTAETEPWPFVSVLVGTLVVLFCFRGLFMVNPNEGKVLQMFGAYRGTVRTPGLRWSNPFYWRSPISLRVRNFESSHLKVNDHDGTSIEIAAVVVWKVVDTAEACFEVDNYEHFVHVQSEAALRNLATRYPYDAHSEGELSLRGSTGEIADQLKGEIQNRLAKAGVQVIEARLSHMAYAPEIAQTMLRRQQAGAVVAARQKIVEGAVGMVEMALNALSKNKIVELDEERKAAMVSNLLVVLCGETQAQPVVNTGTLHH